MNIMDLRKTALTLTLTQPSLRNLTNPFEIFSPLRSTLFGSTFFSHLPEYFSKTPQVDNTLGSSTNRFSNKKKSPFKIIKFILTVAIAVVILALGIKLISSMNFSSAKDKNSNSEVKSALATQEINREFTFPLKNSKNEQISSLKYMIEKAELRDEIIIKGQRATAVSGRTFVILTVKVTNDYKQSISINTRDYMRLSVNGNDQELLAPDIHNDPVEVQAISTKYTRLGFPINTSDKNLILLVGEINGDKERIELNVQ